GARPRRRALPRARAARLAARAPGRLERAHPRLDGGRARGGDRPALLLAPVRAARRVARAARLEPALALVHLRRAGRDGAGLRVDRRLPVRHPRRLLEPEGDRRERLRAVLPRELGLLRPLRVRAVPRRRDAGGARAGPVRPQPPRRLRLGGGDRADLAGAALLVLAVELRGADGRRRGRRRGALALAGGGRPRRRGGRDRGGRAGDAAHPPLAAARVRVGPEQGVERPGEAGHPGDPDRPPPSRRGRRDRRVQARLRRPGGAEGQGAEGGRLAQHGGDGRGRDRCPGAAPARLARLRLALRHAAACGLVLQGPRLPRDRRRDRGDRRAQPVLQRALRGSDVLGPARARGALRPPAAAAAAAGRRRRRAGAVRAAGQGVGVIESWQRVLVLAPHTDDGEFGCGGTMARLVETGADVRYVAFSIATKSLPEGFPPDTLAREVREATAELGIPEANLTLHDFEVRTFPERRQDILELLIALWEEWRPDAVFQPSLHDIHQDHQVVAAEGLRAFKRTTILGYEIPWNNFDFAYQWYSALERSHVERKAAALAKYESQQHRRYADPEYIRNVARTHGINVNREYAEVFQVYRVVT